MIGGGRVTKLWLTGEASQIMINGEHVTKLWLAEDASPNYDWRGVRHQTKIGGGRSPKYDWRGKRHQTTVWSFCRDRAVLKA